MPTLVFASDFGSGVRVAGATVHGKCHDRPMRFFNTEGPVRPDDHYVIPPLDRVDVDELPALIRAKRYFVVDGRRVGSEDLPPVL